MKMTYKQVIESNGGEPLEFSVAVPNKGVCGLDDECHRYVTEDGGSLTAYCWTDDPEVMEWEASFDVDASWQHDGGIGRYDNMHDELMPQIRDLISQIQERLGGEWGYDEADDAIRQL